MQPIDYTVRTPNPLQSALQGVQFGAALQGVQAQRQANELALMQQEQAIQSQQALSQVMQSLAQKVANGTATAADFQQFALVAPKDRSEAAMKIWEGMGKDRQQSMLNFGSMVMAALGSKRPEIGVNLLRERAVAERNAGQEDQAKAYETWAQLAELDPTQSQVMIGGLLQSLPGGDKAIDSWVKVQQERRAQIKAPFELAQSEAEAKRAAVLARFAESNAVLDLQKKGWDITKLQNDMEIAKMNAGIAAMNAQTARAGNDLKRQELNLKLEEMKDKRDTLIREKAADLESARTNIDNMLNTTQRALNTPRSVVRAATGPVDAVTPTIRQSTADYEELLKTLGSQAFLSQVPALKGLGQLSDAEGKKLEAALQSFSLRQSPDRLEANIREAQRLLLKIRTNIADKAGLPNTAPDMPAAQPQMPSGFRVIR